MSSPKTPTAKFFQTLKIGAVFVVVSLACFALARYLEEGKTFDSGSWAVIGILAVAVVVTAALRALAAKLKQK
jgi:hypothetical protein